MVAQRQFDINRILEWRTKNIDRVETAAFHAVQDAISDGELAMRKRVETAVTPTGLARAAKGGHPGRIDSGDMLDEISNDLTSDVHNGNGTIVGKFGWLGEDVARYFLVQEYGDPRHPSLEAMGSLGLGASVAIDTFRNRMNRLL